MLRMDSETVITEHEHIGGLLFRSFSERLGCTDFSAFSYDLHILHLVELPVMDSDFIDEEIQIVVSAMPLDHAPGSDGFNGMFYKKCWNLILPEFKRLCAKFCEGSVSH